MVCFICHKEGHKSYMCKSEEAKKKWGEAKDKKKDTSHTNPINRSTLVDNEAGTHKVTKGGKWGEAKAT